MIHFTEFSEWNEEDMRRLNSVSAAHPCDHDMDGIPHECNGFIHISTVPTKDSPIYEFMNGEEIP